MPLPREDTQRDALLLHRIIHGDRCYRDLIGHADGADLDQRLDRLLAAGYLTFRFTGRRLDVTPAGTAAERRAYRRGWRQGRLIDAQDLYARSWLSTPSQHGAP